MTVKQSIDDFLRYMQYRRGATDTTMSTYRSILSEFLCAVPGISVDKLTIEHIDHFADILVTRDLKPKTFRNKLCVVRSYIRYLYAHDLTDLRFEKIELPPPRQEEMTYLTPCEAARLLEVSQVSLRDYAMIQLLLATGIRVSELIALDTTHIFRRTVSIRNGKGRKHRVTFMTAQTERTLNRYIKEVRGTADGILFPNPDGNRLSRAIICRKVGKYSKRAGIDKRVTVHTLRHTFATQYLDRGGRIEDLQQMLGHADMKTTLLYLHFTNERLHSNYDRTMRLKIA